jgi:hypothetical protein
VQVVHQGETAFVTLFTYDANGNPTWFVASDVEIYAVQAFGGLPAFRGTLYRTRGSPFSAPFDPARGQVTPVGQLFLTPTSDSSLLLTYSVDNVEISQVLVRNTFALPNADVGYTGHFTLRLSTRAGMPFGTRQYDADFILFQDDSRGVLRVNDSVQGVCVYQGPYVQSGRYGSFAGGYTCEGGDAGTFEVSRLEFSTAGVTAEFTTNGRDGQGRGRFGAARAGP